jgi:hypothetical protein
MQRIRRPAASTKTTGKCLPGLGVSLTTPTGAGRLVLFQRIACSGSHLGQCVSRRRLNERRPLQAISPELLQVDIPQIQTAVRQVGA